MIVELDSTACRAFQIYRRFRHQLDQVPIKVTRHELHIRVKEPTRRKQLRVILIHIS